MRRCPTLRHISACSVRFAAEHELIGMKEERLTARRTSFSTRYFT